MECSPSFVRASPALPLLAMLDLLALALCFQASDSLILDLDDASPAAPVGSRPGVPGPGRRTRLARRDQPGRRSGAVVHRRDSRRNRSVRRLFPGPDWSEPVEVVELDANPGLGEPARPRRPGGRAGACASPIHRAGRWRCSSSSPPAHALRSSSRPGWERPGSWSTTPPSNESSCGSTDGTASGTTVHSVYANESSFEWPLTSADPEGIQLTMRVLRGGLGFTAYGPGSGPRGALRALADPADADAPVLLTEISSGVSSGVFPAFGDRILCSGPPQSGRSGRSGSAMELPRGRSCCGTCWFSASGWRCAGRVLRRGRCRVRTDVTVENGRNSVRPSKSMSLRRTPFRWVVHPRRSFRAPWWVGGSCSTPTSRARHGSPTGPRRVPSSFFDASGTDSSQPGGYLLYQDWVYFRSIAQFTGSELWSTDGVPGPDRFRPGPTSSTTSCRALRVASPGR